ncbi:MAG: ATP-binding cassette domain-containing protein [Lachnospiraceae bacterium]|nr:ATP-binding cassette domain-containing protein [Lachnospiraceae bacterium]
MSNIVKTNGLTKKYRNLTAVCDVNMSIEKGDIYALIGENGAGKSTLMKMLSGMAKPTSGDIVLFENKHPEVARYRMGCLIDSPALDTRLNVRDNLEMFARAFGCDREGEVDEILELIGMKKHQYKAIKKTSLGMKQRTAIGIALLGSPDFLILDEPMNGLDPMGIQEIRQLLLKLNAEKKTTILISSHLLDEVAKVATRYGFLKEGKLICELSEEELAEKSRTCLKLKVSDAAKAAMVCEKELSTQNFEVVDAQTIRLFDFVEDSSKVVTAMVQGGVALEEMVHAGESLEEFFNDLMTGGAEK